MDKLVELEGLCEALGLLEIDADTELDGLWEAEELEDTDELGLGEILELGVGEGDAESLAEAELPPPAV